VTGFDVLQRLRDAGVATPILVLSALADEAHKVRCLDLGADDYVTKPAGLLELNARIRARLRRSAAVVVVLGAAEVDLGTREIRRGGVTSALTVREADMLRLLHEARGQVVSRRRFLEQVWHHSNAPSDTRTVDQFIKRLRQKLEDDPANPRHIVTVVGVGYRLDA
jgi:DNA-binding response OmpR family regulator